MLSKGYIGKSDAGCASVVRIRAGQPPPRLGEPFEPPDFAVQVVLAEMMQGLSDRLETRLFSTGRTPLAHLEAKGEM